MDIPIYVKVYVCVRNRKEGDKYLIEYGLIRCEESGAEVRTHIIVCMYCMTGITYGIATI